VRGCAGKTSYEDVLIDILAERAGQPIEYEVVADLDEATLAKPAKAATKSTVGIKGTVAPRKGQGPPKQTSAEGKGRRQPKKLFGGTNKLMAGVGQPIQQDQATPSYWGGSNAGKGVGYGWSLGTRKINTAPGRAPARAAAPAARKGPPKTTFAVGNQRAQPKKLFGGTNKLMAGNGAAIQQAPATPSYWGGKKADKGVGYGWFQRSKALPDVQTNHFQVPPPAPRLGSAMAPKPLVR